MTKDFFFSNWGNNSYAHPRTRKWKIEPEQSVYTMYKCSDVANCCCLPTSIAVIYTIFYDFILYDYISGFFPLLTYLLPCAQHHSHFRLLCCVPYICQTDLFRSISVFFFHFFFFFHSISFQWFGIFLFTSKQFWFMIWFSISLSLPFFFPSPILGISLRREWGGWH